MYYRPAEWRKNKTIWLAWPFDVNLWQQDLLGAQQEFAALVKALHHERLVIIFPNQIELELASKQLGELKHASLTILPYGDIWLRDTLPIFVKDQQDQTVAVIPRFNGWGGKYLFKDDADLSKRVADFLSVPQVSSTVVFEGGAIESDGAGTILTTKQCLLNKNRNPKLTKKAIEKDFANLFGAQKVIWLSQGLKNDHTDGHIDTLARFIGEHRIAIMIPNDRTDANFAALMAIKEQLSSETDAQGRAFELIEIPTPGEVTDRDGKLMPASFLNFIMGEETLVVPLYNTPYDEEAVKIFKKSVKLNVIGLPAKSILTGGGAFHCISQEFYR